MTMWSSMRTETTAVTIRRSMLMRSDMEVLDILGVGAYNHQADACTGWVTGGTPKFRERRESLRMGQDNGEHGCKKGNGRIEASTIK